MNRCALVASILLISAPLLARPPLPATDDEVRSWLAATGDKTAYADANWVYVLDEADVYVEHSGLATTESRQVIKLLTDAGVRRQAVQRFDFDPATRRVTVRSVQVHRRDGQVEQIPLVDMVTQPTVQGIIFWGGDQHVLNIPGLQVGDAIDIRLSKIGFNIAYLADPPAATGNPHGLQPPMPGHWYEVTLFQGNQPIDHKRYSVHMPADMPVQYEVYNGALRNSLWFNGDRHVHTWTAADIPAVKREPRMVALDDCVAKVVMATVDSWEAKSRWFHAVNEGQFDATTAIQQKVAELTAGLESLDAKIAACNHWVADNIRYYGTSRGPREGFTLHRGSETFRDRGGVCKDKAGMLVTLLRVLGVEAYPALTMAGSRVEDIPADQFNHTVTVYRDEDGAFQVLDPTWIPLSREMWSSREALQGLVYGTPNGETLTLSPYYPPDYNQLVARSTSRISAAGDLTLDLDMSMKGYPCTSLRRTLGRQRPDKLPAAFESAVRLAPNAQVSHLEHVDPYDYDQDGFVRLTVAAEDYATAGDDVLLFKLPLLRHPLGQWLIGDLLDKLNPATERRYPYRFRATRGLIYEEIIELPTGWQATDLPDVAEIDHPAVALKVSFDEEPGSVHYTLHLDLKKQIVPADEYVAVAEALAAFHDLADEWIVCARTTPGTSMASRTTPKENAHAAQ